MDVNGERGVRTLPEHVLQQVDGTRVTPVCQKESTIRIPGRGGVGLSLK